MQHSTGQYDDLARVPRARPREGCRRRTTASRHRRHSPPRCSCRVVPPIRDARLVDLNLAVFMCNSVARQERVCRAQRPAAKIDAIATSANGRDRTSAFEPAETPANCGLFLRDRETSVRIGLRGGPGRTRTACRHAVMSNWSLESPPTLKAAEFSHFSLWEALSRAKTELYPIG